MGRSILVAIVFLGFALGATVASSQGIYEYWKAGTKRGPSRSTPAHGRTAPARARGPASSASAPALAPWTSAWFSDSTLVRRRVGETVEALTVPMIGQSFPLPRGGGFVCTRSEGAAPARGGELACVIECDGPELGGRRHNWFYAEGPSGSPALDRVRWSIRAPSSSPRAGWRAFVQAVADSLSRVMGPPAWSYSDRLEAAWGGPEYATTIRLHANPARVDSLELECVSTRLAATHVAGR